jgi:hypothetical protein
MKRLFFLFLVACSSSSTTPTPGATDDAGTPTPEAGTGGSQCSAARDSTLKPIDKVSTGVVKVVSDDGTTKVLYVDGSAGGLPNAGKNPAIYVNLETGTKVEVTDKSSLESTDWDLSVKRTILYTNGGDGGPGQGGAQLVDKTFDAVSAGDATKIATEKFFDADCNVMLDVNKLYIQTTFSPDWYDYDQSSMTPTPKDVSFVVVGGTGTKYKVAITSYTGKPDGTTTAPAGGYFLLKVAAL